MGQFLGFGTGAAGAAVLSGTSALVKVPLRRLVARMTVQVKQAKHSQPMTL